MGTILTPGALAIVGSMNFQRSRTPGRCEGCFLAESLRPSGRCGAQSRSTSDTSALSVKPRT
jgi:hypothetical protein